MIEILLIEDNTDDVELIKYRLKTDGFQFKIRHVLSLEQLAKELANSAPDVILSDFNLRGFTALDALEFVRTNYPKIPFIVVTGSIDEETVAFTIKSGAWDYVVKERLFRLSTAIKAAIERFNENRRTEQVENQLQILSIAVQQASTSVIITDREGNVEFANKKFTEISGYSDFYSEKVNILKSGLLSEKEYKEIWETVISGSQWKGEYQNRTKNGELYWVLASITGVKTNGSEITNFIAIQEDITDKKRIEQELITAKEKAEESDRLKTAFLQNISHEIRTPLNGILGFSRLLDDDELSSEKRKSFIEIIDSSGMQLTRIIEDIIEISKIEIGSIELKNEAFCVNTLIDELNEHFVRIIHEKDKNIRLIPYKASEFGNYIIVADKMRIKQVMVHLLDNAVKFTHNGFIMFGYSFDNKTITFKVSDSGIGVDQSKHEIIFERFCHADDEIRKDYGGTGLGLSICKRVVEQMQGEIGLISEPGKGSEFYFSINKQIEKEELKPAPAIAGLKQLFDQKTILIAEDVWENFLLLNEYLEPLSCTVIHAINGKQVIDFLTSGITPDLILMDIKMPVMNGLEAHKTLRSLGYQFPVIAQTAYAVDDDKQNIMKEGFTDFISKPINKNKLLQLLSEYLKG